MFHIRTVKTASSAIAVQVVRYAHRKMIIAVHLGSAHNQEELLALKRSAADWIETASQQQPLFPTAPAATTRLISLNKCRYLGIRYPFIREVMYQLFRRFQFHAVGNTLLTDLVLMRIVEPASKLRSLELLEQFFGISYPRKDFYRSLPLVVAWRTAAEAGVLALARKEYHFDFAVVFYDVTTLYFEVCREDTLRQPGFSKDGKPHQPQILIGLIVTSEGFPVAYEIFKGNTFEGHTLLPSISALQRKYHIRRLTVVADAAMITRDNIRELVISNFTYIVGARTGNLSHTLLQKVCRGLRQRDGATLRLTTAYGGLVCDFSLTRYRKDKRELEQQLKKAETLLQHPGAIKRVKFIKSTGRARYELNAPLLEKTKHLLGIKGYYTNLPATIDNQMILQQYRNLWRVEQAFRIAKSDLQFRPIYHFKKASIEAHILICFMALAVCKYMEMKTGTSTKQMVQLLKGVTDARILNTLTHEEIIMRSEIPDEVKLLLAKLNLSY